jgi:hypothetical protein
MQSFLNVAVWVWLAEIFPLHMRGLGIGIAVILGWATTGFLRFFPALVEAIHINGVFFRFPGCLGGAAQCAGPSLPGLGCRGDARWPMGHPWTCEPHNARHRRRYRRRRQRWVRSRIAGYCRRGSRSW